jgi:threonine/homoserine/homoserine lactone efflux protein
MTPAHLLAFALIALGIVITPGPNMLYVASRAISQGRIAGFVSLAGVGTAFVVYGLFAAFGISALFMAVPLAFEVLRAAGAAYLLWLAWQAIRPGGTPLFHPRTLPADSPPKLFAMGFLTNLLNPKAAVLYVSLLPQFVNPRAGHVLQQLLILAATQIAISMTVNGTVVFAAGTIARWLAEKPSWVRVQKWLMGTMLTGLALRLALEGRR